MRFLPCPPLPTNQSGGLSLPSESRIPQRRHWCGVFRPKEAQGRQAGRVSVSGRNAAGIDMALAAKAKGMKVIGVTSLDYSTQVTSRHSSGKMLKDVSDIVLDICGIKGDSVLYDERVSEKFCSTSTVVAMTLLVGVVGETIQLLAEEGINPPIWVSGNLDRGDEINKEHIKNYKGRVSIL